MIPSAQWFFFGARDAEPTIGDLTTALAATGLEVVAESPTVDADGTPIGRQPANEADPLCGTPLYLGLPALGGTISLASAAPAADEDALAAYTALGGACPERVGVVACVAAWDHYDEGRVAAQIATVLQALGRLFGQGQCYCEEDAILCPTEALELAPPPERTRTFHVLADFELPPWSAPAIRDRFRAHPVLGAATSTRGTALRVHATGLVLTDTAWGELYTALLDCAFVARGGRAFVICEGDWETTMPARGGEPVTAPAPEARGQMAPAAVPRRGQRLLTATV